MIDRNKDTRELPFNKEGRYKVLEYVGQDTIATYNIADMAQELNLLAWYSQSRNFNTLDLDGHLPLIKECLEWEVPNTNWMTFKMPSREEMYAWTGYSCYEELKEYYG